MKHLFDTGEITDVIGSRVRLVQEDRLWGLGAGRSEEPTEIGNSLRIKGQIVSKQDLYVDFDVQGTIEAPEHKVTIGPNGKVHATVKAREVVVLGSILGNVDAFDRLEIRNDAKLVGDVRTARVIIEDGAYFKGSIDIAKPESAGAITNRQPSATSTPTHFPAPAGNPKHR